jgi:predicted  nucleic acid-binding Zn-ribbon protein
LPIDVQSLKTERDVLKEQLRILEKQQRDLETQLKTLRQKEIRGKREIEALSTLIELGEPKPEGAAPEAAPTQITPAG